MKAHFALLSLFVFLGGSAMSFAQDSNESFQKPVTSHTGDLTLTLKWVDAKGKSEEIFSQKYDYQASWPAQLCHVKLADRLYAPCTLDTSRDLINANGELIMKNMPQSRFTAGVIDGIFKHFAIKDRGLNLNLPSILLETRSSRAEGFDLPFYTCANSPNPNQGCLKTGKNLLLFNAYQGNSFVERSVEIEHLRFAGRKLVLSFRIENVKAHRGAFQTISDNTEGNFVQ